MSGYQPAVGQHAFLQRPALGKLIEVLRQEGYTVIGPTVAQDVVALRPIESEADLPRGMQDEQAPGEYRLGPGDPERLFAFVNGADSPKRYVFPPRMALFRIQVQEGRFAARSGPPHPPRLALLGVRPCDVAALLVSDRVFISGGRCEHDAYYLEARKQMFVVAVNCTRPGGNCFCASMKTGPQATEGFDLALTELRGGFLVKIGSGKGAQLAAKLEMRQPTDAELELAELRLEQAREHMGLSMRTDDIRPLLDGALEHPRWEDVAKRCLACGNCTMVCPTCFCSSVVDGTELTNGQVSRQRLWDCCYTHQFTYTTSGPVRNSIRARYRHWLRHKLDTWWEQFGTSGCVGCGRCITWCPVGINITEEVAAIRSANALASGGTAAHNQP